VSYVEIIRGDINMSKAKVLSAVSKALVGTEKLAPEVEAAARKYVSETGRINHEALGKRRLLGDLLIGKKGTTEALKARYRQGGIVGPGGLIMGEFAMDPRYKKLVTNYRQAAKGSPVLDPYSGQELTRAAATKKLVTKGVGQSVNPLFLLGFPAMDVSTAINTADSDEHGGMSGILGALAGGAGFAIGGPMGLVGGIGASMLGESLGKSVGGMFDPSSTPLDRVLPAQQAARIPRASDVILDAAVPS
jgi:hypothetical protein